MVKNHRHTHRHPGGWLSGKESHTHTHKHTHTHIHTLEDGSVVKNHTHPGGGKESHTHTHTHTVEDGSVVKNHTHTHTLEVGKIPWRMAEW